MSTSAITDALSRVQRLLFSLPVVESFLARREAGAGDSDSDETAGALAGELIAHQSGDGSWGQSLVLTTETLLLLRELQPFQCNAASNIERALAWLRGRQRARGSFVDTCTPERHALSLCHHFAGGFFSPGPASVSFAGATLASGALLPTDEDARLALSALALRALLDHEQPARDDLLQIEGLLRVTDLLFSGRSRISTPAAVTVLSALTRAPRTPVHTALLHGALSRLAGLQRADGSWPGAEGFHVADGFMIAIHAGYGSPLFDMAITRTAEMLQRSLHADGSWGNGSSPRRLLIGWRTLRYAAGIRGPGNQGL